MLEKLAITHLDVVTSTSDHLAAAARINAPEGTAYRANLQTAGRGRRGRDWQSPRGNLYVSILLRPLRDKSEWPSLSLIAALALHDAVMAFRNAEDIRLKWPNDLLYRGHKFAGLLLEVIDDGVMLGCGVNLNAEPDDMMTPDWKTGRLNHGRNLKVISADALMCLFERHLISRYNRWEKHGFASQRQDWQEKAAHLGHDIMLDQGGGNSLAGVFTHLDDDGSLCLLDAFGVSHHITAGDVVRARLKEK
ncbi:MAG: biotin--[acetyl-CoA-carboxylase] ligase [Candidatus Puniceispirillales bacterium WSBS_2018_MAG_OTU23]